MQPHVGEVSAKFYRQRVPHGQRDGSLRRIADFLAISEDSETLGFMQMCYM
jgi:hypothetical protein